MYGVPLPALTDVVGVLPLQADLQVVVLVHKAQEPVEELLALLIGHAVDVAHVPANGEDALPSGHWVRPDDGVDRPEDLSDVFRGAPRLVVELEAVALRRGGKDGLVECYGQFLEELLIGLAEEIIYFISRRPKSVYKIVSLCSPHSCFSQGELTAPCLGKLHESERAVVRRDGLKRDVTVPLRAALLLGAQSVPGVPLVVLPVLLGADGADLRVIASKLALRV